jgi:hypothetical protein
MEAPVRGNNATQSYFDFDRSIGKFRFGVQNGRLFFQKNLNSKANEDKAIHYVDGKLVNQYFSGVVRLDNDLTHYTSKTIDSALEVTLADDPIIGGSAEARLIGDGATTPTFSSDFTKSGSSDDYDTTEDTVNKVVFYYDGDEAFYSITVLS